jgi:hypothetical protein
MNWGTVGFYLDVFRLDPRFAVLDDNRRSTDPPSVTGNMNCLLVMIDVHTHEFIDFPCSPKFSKIVDKTSRIASDANDRAIDVNSEGSRRIDLRSCRKRNIWRPGISQRRMKKYKPTHLQPLTDAPAR